MANTSDNHTKMRGARWALLISIGLNVAFLGAFAAIILRGPPPQRLSGPALSSYARALPEEHRHDLGHRIRDNRREWREARAAVGAQREKVAQAVAADPPDLEQIGTLLEEESTLVSALSQQGIDLLVEQIGEMNQAERAAFSKAVLDPPRRRQKKDR